jgi:hypothetical protein
VNTLMIGYDLKKKGKDYASLIKAIKDLANGYWHHLDSTWFIGSDLSTSAARDYLMEHIDADDELLVLRVTRADWAGVGFSQAAYKWLQESLYGGSRALQLGRGVLRGGCRDLTDHGLIRRGDVDPAAVVGREREPGRPEQRSPAEEASC